VQLRLEIAPHNADIAVRLQASQRAAPLNMIDGSTP